jgi:hypothetical protein
VLPRRSVRHRERRSGPRIGSTREHGSELSEGPPAVELIGSAIRVFGHTQESTGSAPVASETYAGVGARCPSPEATAVGSLLLFALSRSGPVCDANRGLSRVRLPPLPLALLASIQLDVEESAPEALRALGIIGGKLDQRQMGVDHGGDDRRSPSSHLAPRRRCRVAGPVPAVAGASSSSGDPIRLSRWCTDSRASPPRCRPRPVAISPRTCC